jgi:hypothetical protein
VVTESRYIKLLEALSDTGFTSTLLQYAHSVTEVKSIIMQKRNTQSYESFEKLDR